MLALYGQDKCACVLRWGGEGDVIAQSSTAAEVCAEYNNGIITRACGERLCATTAQTANAILPNLHAIYVHTYTYVLSTTMFCAVRAAIAGP